MMTVHKYISFDLLSVQKYTISDTQIYVITTTIFQEINTNYGTKETITKSPT